MPSPAYTAGRSAFAACGSLLTRSGGMATRSRLPPARMALARRPGAGTRGARDLPLVVSRGPELPAVLCQPPPITPRRNGPLDLELDQRICLLGIDEREL